MKASVKKFSLCVEHRNFLKEGSLKKRSSKGRDIPYIFFLFTDILLYASNTSLGRFKIHYLMDLRSIKIHDASSRDGVNRNLFSFRVVNKTGKSFLVLASSESEKHSWIRAINNAIGSLPRETATESRKTIMSIDARVQIMQKAWQEEAESLPAVPDVENPLRRKKSFSL